MSLDINQAPKCWQLGIQNTLATSKIQILVIDKLPLLLYNHTKIQLDIQTKRQYIGKELLVDIEINFQTHIPIYTQLMQQIKLKIASGELNPGDQLPTVRQLAAELHVNFNTIARAYRLLDEAGFISTQHGRGTYILEQPNAEAAEKLRHQTLAKLAEHFLTQTRILGHSPDQIRAALEEKIVDDQIERANILAKRKLKPSRNNQ